MAEVTAAASKTPGFKLPTLIDLGNGLEIPASWLPEGVTVEQVAAGLRPLLDKEVRVVLPTHGQPADRAALERALA